jgi:teichuronic acid biosynthesis glycosyltransferase TuaC
MKVLSFTTLWPNHKQPLHGLFVRERIKALAKPCELRVVAPVPWFIPVKFFGEQYYNYTQIQRYEKQDMLDVFHPRYLVLPKVCKFTDGLLMFYSLRNFLKHMRNEFPYNLIDAHYAYPDGYAAGRIAQELGIPYTVTVRGNDMTVFAKEKLRGELIRRSLISAERVFCVSRSLQDIVIALGIPIEKTEVLENGVDLHKFHRVPRSETRHLLQLPQESFIILSVGHLVERKGFHLLIQAVSDLQSKRDQTPMHLFIVGGESHWDSSYKDGLVRQIRESGLHDLVSLVGPKKPDELKYWYSAADVFCLVSSREGCPNVVLESLACGTPVVATAVSGTPDIISDPELGILVERDVSSIRLGIAKALDRTWDHDKIIAHVRKQYSWETTATKIYNIFERVLL